MKKTIEIISIFAVVLFLVYLYLPKELVEFADIFNKFAIGVGALVGTLLGTNYLREELSKRREEEIKYYKLKYPDSKFGTDWEIIVNEGNSDRVYLWDKVNLQKHHIVNMLTMQDLGWDSFERRVLTVLDFLSISEGERIRTIGQVGDETSSV